MGLAALSPTLPLAGLALAAFLACGTALGWQAVRLRKAQSKVRRLEASRRILEAQCAEMTEAAAATELRLAAMVATQGDIIRRARMNQLGQLVATVAHEIRNPLGSLRISAFLLKRKLPDNHECAGLIERMDTGINRCDAIITQLLDYSSETQLNLAVDDVHAWLGHLLQEQAAKLPKEIELRLIMAEGPLEAIFDHLRLRRAVLNLVNNAMDALTAADQADGTASVIDVEVIASQRGVEIEVRDNGCGIPPEILERVGEPLFTTKNFGTGLGVANSRKVAELHGGALEIESDPTGTRARIWFPKAQTAVLAA